jgi:aspartate dehydrogenase
MKKKIGIIGCGAIGSFLAKKISTDLKPVCRLWALSDIDKEKAERLSKALNPKPLITGFDMIIGKSDIVIEAASASASLDIARRALKKKKTVFIMSSGGILNNANELFCLAKKNKARIILPSGAVCGLDGIKSAAIGGIHKACLTTKKPPRGLMGAPFIEKNRINLNSITGETLIFEGTADEAVKAFPKNINVSALLSIAGIGAKKTTVKIITSPEYMVNTHEIEIEGDFGRIITVTENMACADNPKTSFLACLSVLSALKQVLCDSVRIGS